MDKLRLYRLLLAARLRSQLQYRVSFALEATSSFTTPFVELIAILILFRTFPNLGGWTAGEVVFLYGLATTSLAVAEMLSSGIDQTSDLIREGNFDRILIRPVNPLLQVLATDFQLRKIGRLMQGGVALTLAQLLITPHWTLLKGLVFFSALCSTVLVFCTIFLIGAAICFWTIDRSEIQNVFVYGGTEIASNPLNIYDQRLQALFLYLIPIGLTVFYPALYILGKPDPLMLPPFMPFLAPVVALLFLSLGLLIWEFGLRHYQGTGS